MMRSFFFSLVLCLGLFRIPVAWAADPYSQTLLTRDDSTEAQDGAIREAMRRLLIGLGGAPGVWQEPQYEELLAKAPLFVDRFSYPKKFNNPWPRPMSIRFDRQRLQSKLGGLGGSANVSGGSVLLWLLQGQGGNYWLSAPDEPQSAYLGVRDMAAGAGIELLLPMVDMAARKGFIGDQGELAANQSLVRLSEPYGASRVLIGRLQMQGPGIEADWTLVDNGQDRHWNQQAVDESQAVQQGLAQVAKELGLARPAPRTTPATATGVELIILGAGQGSAATLDKYLKQQSLIAQIQPKGATADGLAYSLSIYGKADALREALQVSGLLEPAAAPAAPKKKAKPQAAFDPFGDMRASPTGSKPAAPATPLLYFRLR